MSNKSNNNGRAYEYACLMALENQISKYRPVKVLRNSSYNAAKRAWESIEYDIQSQYQLSAISGVITIFDLEPLIIEDGTDDLELKIQSDSEGENGDVRDVLIVRRGIQWEIGLSIKHNHTAVKHSRLSKKLDFGEKWFGVKCSEDYWSDIAPIFSYLSIEKAKLSKWSELPTKDVNVYVPLLQAFMNEVQRSYDKYGSIIARRMVEYLLGHFDFYKVISLDDECTTQIQSFNLYGTLNRYEKDKPLRSIPRVVLPTRIIRLDFKPNSNNTIELYLDNGWQLGFRLHSASTIVEPSLKFDIRIIGMPTTIILINCRWGEK